MPIVLEERTYSTCGDLLKTKQKDKKFKKQDIHAKFINENWIKFAFNMTWFMAILKIYLEEQHM